MALSDYTPETAIILYRDKPLMTVRGLSTDDLAWLMQTHLDDAERVFRLYQEAGKDIFTTISSDAMVMQLITQAPGLAANIIATCADDRDNAEAARRLGMAIQISALVEIMRMTFEDVGGPKAFFASLGMMGRKLFPPMGTDAKKAA